MSVPNRPVLTSSVHREIPAVAGVSVLPLRTDVGDALFDSERLIEMLLAQPVAPERTLVRLRPYVTC